MPGDPAPGLITDTEPSPTRPAVVDGDSVDVPNIKIKHDPYAALRQRDYCLLLTGNVLAAMSAEVQFTVVEWEIFERTGSYELMGYAGLAQFLPLLLLALPAGQLADRFSRKHMLMIAHWTMALTSLGLMAVSLLGAAPAYIFVFLALAGVSRAIGMPARASLIPLVVPGEMLGNAVTWSSTGFQIAMMAGPALGGLLLALARQPALAYGFTVIALLGCSMLTWLMRPRHSPPSSEPRNLRTLLAGIRFVWGSQLLFAAITLDLFAVLFGGCTALLPAFAKQILDVDATGYGILRAAPAIGAFVMALVLAHRPPLAKPGRALLWSVAGFGVTTIVFGLSENFYLSLAMLLLTGAFDNISVVIRGTLMQILTPDAMRGRVAAVNSLFISSTNQLGAFESGMAAHWLGLVGSVVFGGCATIVVVAAAALRWRPLRRLEPLHKLKAEG
ncbi:MAG TPA: MFS transporter [Gemmataceae bacterium]|nr:MFS transporter [Gemmataceae bacterium]